MNKYITFFIYIILIFTTIILYIILTNPIKLFNKTIEEFTDKQLSEYREDKNKIILYPDNYDKKYTRLFDLVTNEPSIYRHDIILIKNITKLNDNSKVLDAGCGLGKHLQIIKELVPGITIEGIDKSRSMINQCKIRNPGIELLCTSLTIPEIYKSSTLSHILSLHETLNHNTPKEISNILNNYHKWLIPKGYLIMHVIDPEKLDPAPRAFSQYFKSEDGTNHSLTYFESFTHEAWWEKKSDAKYWYSYCEKYIFPGDKIKIQTTPLWIPPVNKMLQYISRHNFKLKKVIELNDIEVSQFNLYIFTSIN